MLFMLYLFEITDPIKRLCSLLQNSDCTFSDPMNVVFNFWLSSIYQILNKTLRSLTLQCNRYSADSL